MTPRGDDSDPFDPAEYLVPLVREATVRIHGAEPGHPLYGSGFFVAPNWVLTCAHVACRAPQDAAGAGDRREEAAAVGQPAARKVTVGWGDRMLAGVVEWSEPAAEDGGGNWPAPDLALVRLLDAVQHPCVYLSERTAKTYPSNQVAFFGYTHIEGAVESYDGRCTISGQVGGSGTGSMLRLGNEDEMPYGVSGGPVLDLLRGEVIGVVKGRRRGQDGGLAVSLQQLRRLPSTPDPADDLYQRVMAAHDQHHADRHGFVGGRGGTWTDAHDQIDACAGRALTPGQRTELLGLLAQLRPPADAESLRTIVE
ncbi:MAG: trypsin-like peptidase domain-containing protein, partial [Streptomyces sp.]|nr:trypsin-like peptidase domain-containing protein [Streptomyces sp.]